MILPGDTVAFVLDQRARVSSARVRGRVIDVATTSAGALIFRVKVTPLREEMIDERVIRQAVIV